MVVWASGLTDCTRVDSLTISLILASGVPRVTQGKWSYLQQVQPTLVQSWASVCDAGPAFNQRWYHPCLHQTAKPNSTRPVSWQGCYFRSGVKFGLQSWELWHRTGAVIAIVIPLPVSRSWWLQLTINAGPVTNSLSQLTTETCSL